MRRDKEWRGLASDALTYALFFATVAVVACAAFREACR